ncbi:MAG: peptidylprolyl isomerase [Propionibacteriaceae bacterium]
MTNRSVFLCMLPIVALAACAVDSPANTSPSNTPGNYASAQTSSASPAPGTQESSDPAASTATAKTASCNYIAEGKPAKPVDPPSSDQVKTDGTVTFTITMNEGVIPVTMDRSKTPCTVNNFESLVKQDYFNDTQCHRLVETGIFVLQCGDPTGKGTGGPGYRFADELTGQETYPAGTLAMANAGPGTATNGSQFFFVYADTKLPAGYTVFGKTDEQGLGVINRIAAMGHTGDGVEGKPINEARITSVTAG